MINKLVCYFALSALFELSATANINGIVAPDIHLPAEGPWQLYLHGIDTDKLVVDEANEEYQRFVVLAGDYELFERNFGKFMGSALYHLPTGWLMSMYRYFAQNIPSWHWFILTKETHEVVGKINFYKKSSDEFAHQNVFEIGGLIQKQYRSQGILRSFKTMIMPKLKELIDIHGLNVDAIVIETQTDNEPIKKLALELGLEPQGVFARDIKIFDIKFGSINAERYWYSLKE